MNVERSLWVTVLLVLLLPLVSAMIDLGDAGGPFLDALALDTTTYLEERPGRILYDDWGPETVWTSQEAEWNKDLSASSQLLSVDMDLDGDDELVFGTQNHSLIVLDVPSGVEMLNMSFECESRYGCDVAVGNLDRDRHPEIVFSDGDRLRCVDFRTQRVLWTRPYQLAWDSRHVIGVITLVDPDGDGVDDILFRTPEAYCRLDANGDLVHAVNLNLFLENPTLVMHPGRATRMVVDDLDDDGDLEVLLSDMGWSAIESPYDTGRHVWIINLETGRLEFSEEYDGMTFMSDPMPFTHDARKYVAIGLLGWHIHQGLLVLDLEDMTHERIDVSPAENSTIAWLSLLPSEDDAVLVLGDHGGSAMAWSFRDREVRWSRLGATSASMESPMVVCDIDNDEEFEVLVPLGPVLVFDAVTGELEISIEVSGILFHHERTAVGDFDGDGYTEICQGLHSHREEVYTIEYIDTDPIQFWVVPPTDLPLTLYAGIENDLPILLTGMTTPRLPEAIDISMSNGPWGTFCEFRVDPYEGTVVAPEEGRLSVPACSVEHAAEGTLLNLSIVPSWDFSFRGLNGMTVSFVSRMGTPHIETFADVFVVERDLELADGVEAVGPDGAVRDGDWLPPSTPLLISGLDVVYEASGDVRPPRDAFILELFDGAEWSSHSFPGGEDLELALTAPGEDGEFSVRVRVYQVPTDAHGVGEFETTLGVDGGDPFVVGSFPDDASWFCDPLVTVALIVGDNGSGVDPGSVEYRLVRDPDATDGPWVRVAQGDLEVAGRLLTALVEPTFTEGSTHVQWRFRDRVGHGSSFAHMVNVDLHSLSFYDFSPTGWIKYTTQDIPVNVTVSDRGGSGVNASSLEFSYSHTDLLSFSEWSPVDLSEDDGRFVASLAYDGVEGRTNLVRFRGRDMAGNEAVSSHVYAVLIDTIHPDVEIEEPYLGRYLDPAVRSFRVNITDLGSGVTGVIWVTVDDKEGNASITPNMVLVESSAHHAVFDVAWDNEAGYHLNIHVMCKDVAGNYRGASNGFFYDRPPVINGTTPEDGSVFEEGARVGFGVVAEDPEGEVLVIEWWLDGTVLLSREAAFNNSSLPVGTHTISVIVRDRYHEVVETLGITVREAPEDPPEVTVETDPWSSWWLIVLVVVITVVAGLLMFRMRYTEER